MGLEPTDSGKRFRILNQKSGYYLGLEGDSSHWKNDDVCLAIRDPDLYRPTLENSQVWTFIMYRTNQWLLMNQYSMLVACISRRSTSNDGVAIQYHTQGLDFQLWNLIQRSNQTWLIQNVSSGKFIGPHGRSTSENKVIIQWDDQTSLDNYQAWELQPA